MKKLLIFAGSRYYPSGGIKDLFGSADTVEEALVMLLSKSSDHDWWHIVDHATMKVVKSGTNGLYS